MNVAVVLEQRFSQTPDGAVWTDGQFPYEFWRRYLCVFDAVRIIARVRQVDRVDGSALRSDGPQVSIEPAPHYHGMWQYLKNALRVKRALRNAVERDSAVILRIGSQLANIIHPNLQRDGHPFGVEVVADPYDVFSPGAIQHPLRPFLRWHFTRLQRRQCKTAAAASYVTNEHLQRRYPCADGAMQIACSSVELPAEAFASKPHVDGEAAPHRLVTVASLSQQHKRIDVLIDAVQKLVEADVDVQLAIVGDGRLRPELEAQAQNAGLLQDRVRFVGQLAGAAAVREELAKADLFVMPTKHEGLPRALLEAMAMGLPCVATRVGGIPEILEAENMVEAGDPDSLAVKIREVIQDAARRKRMATRNLDLARGYEASLLAQRRTEFYQHLKQLTQAWVDANRGRNGR